MDFPYPKAREVIEAYAKGERNFRGIVLCGACFANPDVSDPTSYDLSGANFSAGIFTGTFFGPANLSHCNFAGALIEDASFRGANMHKVNLSRVAGSDVDLSEVNLEEANIRQSSIYHSSLRKSNLRKAILAQADLSLSDLRGADFRGANLSFCNMHESSIDRADFREAFENHTVFGDSYDPGTIYPNGRIDEGCFRSEAEFRGELDTENTIFLEKELLQLYQNFYDSLFENSNNQHCEHEGCSRNRVQNSVLCKKHYFEMIQRKECPFT
jgi:Pentapeptide repeats (9 copies)/Pentapeptide repeats (8 copies)